MSRTRIALTGALFAAMASSGLLAANTAAEPAPGEIVEGVDVVTTLVASRSQKVKAFVHPAIAQPGLKPAAAGKAKSVVTVKVKPSKKRQPVLLQRKAGKKWVKAGASRTTKAGYAEFTAPTKKKGKFQTYRVVAKKAKGVKGGSSKGVSTAKWASHDFLDEFGGSTLDATKWGHRLQGYSAASKRACSKADPRAVSVSGGTANLKVLLDEERSGGLLGEKCTREDGQKFSYRLNANVGTEGKYSFRYGYAAARIKFQPLRGQHGSFWLQGGKEIDVVEYFGDSHPSPMTSWVYDYDSGSKVGAGGGESGSVKKLNRYGADWSEKYHVFSVEWTPKKYVFRIDGKQVWQTTKLVSQTDQALIMSLLSSDYYLEYMDESKLPQTMNVDWIRVWER